ncbi:scarecrow-like protein 3 [Zingiber officinale]|uniref:scarecrow-like protein 3 n=1 Tax=Zingiber officinale TaxID=94328 RepID=UPI001C4BC284|nr:scarecrow-like protein 3 [Zingiber officinale]
MEKGPSFFAVGGRQKMASLLRNVAAQDDGSSLVTSSPFKTLSMMSLPPPSLSPSLSFSPWLCELKSDERGLCLIHYLLNCANHVAAGSLDRANAYLEQIALLADRNGDAMQRIASHFSEALARRALRLWPGIYHSLDSAFPVAEFVSARRNFLDLCPFLRVAYVVSNQAIMEAMEGEKVVHIVDLSVADPTQWLSLLQGLRRRPEGPPHLKITGVHEHRDLLNHTAACLSKEAERLDIPFQFNSVVTKLENLDVEILRIKTGEALAINSVLQLHTLLAADMPKVAGGQQLTLGEFLDKDHIPSRDSAMPSPATRVESVLAALQGLSPMLMVVTEQEADHNGSSLGERFVEALFYYAALFDCLDSTAARASVERLRVEKVLLGEEIKNIIACDGWERKERHEKVERWARRLHAAGFRAAPLSHYSLLQGRRLLPDLGHCEGYNVREEKGCLMMCWQDRPLFSVSSWKCNKQPFH